MHPPGGSGPVTPFSEARSQNEMGMRHLAEGRPLQALRCFDAALRMSPRAHLYHHNRAVALERMGRIPEAEAGYRKVISLEPQFTLGYIFLANLLIANNERRQAAEALRKAHATEPDSCRGNLQLSRALAIDEDWEGAVEFARRALEIDPSSVDALLTLGNLLQRLGKFGEAAEVLMKAIDLNPRSGAAYSQLATGQKFTQNDRPVIDRMIALLSQGRLPALEASQLGYAIGKGLSDIGEYESAMKHYDRANFTEHERLKAAGRRFDPEKYRKTIERGLEGYTPAFFDSVRALGSKSEKPVFVVGMIRSGTTLVEQILSNHPSIVGGGEQMFWLDRITRSPQYRPGQLSAAEATDASKQYLELLERIGPGAARVTDKMPLNYSALGHIHAVFPNARIIHCRRSPIDTCLSIYMTSTTFAHQRQDIVFAYRLYQKAMTHWREVLPAAVFMETDYEELVSDPEPTARRMIEFVGLEWDDACLQHDQNEGGINTPSLWQARQPIYKTSMEKWRRYEPWLGEFRELLDC